MLKKYVPLAVLIAMFALPVFAAELPLTISQVEKISGVSGLATKPAKYDKVGTNFVTDQGKTIITLKVAPAAIFEVWKSQPSMDDQTALAGIGEEAVISKKGHYVCYKKSGQGVCVVRGISLPGAPSPLSDAQIVELAKLAAAR